MTALWEFVREPRQQAGQFGLKKGERASDEQILGISSLSVTEKILQGLT